MILFENFIIGFLGITNHNFSKVLFVLLPLIVLGSLNYLFGIIGLANLNKEKLFNRVTITGGVLNLILCWLLSENYGAIGSAIAILVAELVVFLLVINYLLKIKKIK